MSTTPHNPIDLEHAAGEHLRYVFTLIIRCPVLTCRSEDHQHQKTRYVDGVKNHDRKCRLCGHNFTVIYQDDDPNFGCYGLGID